MSAKEYQRMLQSDDARERVMALEGLVSADPAGARDVVLDRLGDPDPAVRIAAMKLGARVRPALGAEDLEGLLHDGDEGVRLRSVDVLAKLPEPLAPARLAARLETEASTKVIATLIKALGEAGGIDLTELLMGYLDHADDRVRANAIEALDRLMERTLRESMDALKDDRSNRVRANAALLMSRFDPKAGAEILAAMAQDESKWFRLSAGWAAAASGHPAMIRAVLPLLRDQDPDVQMQTIQAICRNPEPEAVAELKRLGKESLDPELVSYLERTLESLRT